MNQPAWFSTKVRLVCLIESIGALRYMDSVYLFQSGDFDSAFRRALELGKTQERSYLNADNQQVVWKLKEVISLDSIAAKSLDGAEVYSEPIDLGYEESIPFLSEFHPEKSHPTQTL